MSKNKILIIDDDVDFAESTKVVLEASGYQVSASINKQEGLRRIEQSHPDLIIMDVMMDKMSDGFDLSRRLKSDDKYKKIPIFMLTAVGEKTGFKFHTASDDKSWVPLDDYSWLPIDDYAEKPIKPDELISRVKKLLE